MCGGVKLKETREADTPKIYHFEGTISELLKIAIRQV